MLHKTVAELCDTLTIEEMISWAEEQGKIEEMF